MNIDLAIEKLIAAKSNGAEELQFFDPNWNEYALEDIHNPESGNKVATVSIFLVADEDEDEE